MEFEPRPEFRPSLWGLLLRTDLQRASGVISTKADIMSVFLSPFSKQSHLCMERNFQIKGFEEACCIWIRISVTENLI